LGHGAGDELLVATARRLTACLRPSDTVARLGGDEFTVLLEEVTGGGEVERVVARIQEGLAVPFEVAGSEVSVTASIGVVSEVSTGNSPEEFGVNPLLRTVPIVNFRPSGHVAPRIPPEACTPDLSAISSRCRPPR
jgi:hypothetical protein